MRVLIDTTFARRGPSGTATYLKRLIPALRRMDVDVVTAANQRRRPPAGGGIGSARNAAADAAWLHVELPAWARRVQADVVHHPLPAWSPAIRAAQVVTIHDLAFEHLPDAFDPRFRAWARVAHRLAAHRVGAVVCVSEATAADARALWRVPASRIVVARHGPGTEPDHAFDGPRAERFFLYVGDDEPRKNLDLLLVAHRRYREAGGLLPLVLAGAARARGEAVEVVRTPDDAALAQLYAEAVALVHPALHEGFGLTVLEAMSAGAPVVAVGSPGVVEVGGDACRYVAPGDPDALAQALAAVEHDAGLRRDLALRGRRRAAEFSWARAARSHRDAYALALHG